MQVQVKPSFWVVGAMVALVLAWRHAAGLSLPMALLAAVGTVVVAALAAVAALAVGLHMADKKLSNYEDDL